MLVCRKKRILKKTTADIQRMQSVTRGYFGGYIGKRQPGGGTELKKCLDKLCRLRLKTKSHSKAAQLRAASGRLMTELEMNSTYRGSVEVFNLCRHLRTNDVLFAECIRTFSSVTVDGRSWMYRLESSERSQSLQEHTMETYGPPTKRPNVRSGNAKPVDMDIYGFRPLIAPWIYLSPYEFLMRWRAEPLLAPTGYYSTTEDYKVRWHGHTMD